MKTLINRLLRMLIAGALAALPLAATLLLVGWLLSLVFKLLGPKSMLGSALSALGLGVGGSEALGYVIGLLLIVAALLGLGALVELGLQRGFARLLDRLLRAIPLVRTIWDLAQRVAGLLDSRDSQEKKPMAAVWVRFGGQAADAGQGVPGQGAAIVLALLSNPTPVMVAGQPCLAVLVPTAPIPVGGGLIFVPPEWVTPADIGAEALTSLYVSMGVTAPEHLPVVA